MSHCQVTHKAREDRSIAYTVSLHT